MLHLQLDTSSGVPIYRQLMDQIRRYVLLGALSEGDQLPSIRALAEQLRVNPSTVVKAYTELEHAGIIERQHGRGVFVGPGAAKLLDSSRGEPQAAAALDEAADQLALRARELGMDPPTVREAVEAAMARIMGGEG